MTVKCWSRRALTLLLLHHVLVLMACGGGSDNGPVPRAETAAIRTLAYVVTDCHEDATGSSFSQKLQVVRGDAAPMTIAEVSTLGRLPALGLCRLYGQLRVGDNSAYAGVFQRLGVSPDGSSVVFEVTFKFSLLTKPPLHVPDPLTPEQEGIFLWRADGTAVRRLGDPSREPAQQLFQLPTADTPGSAYLATFFSFSPDGRTIAFSDRGPGPPPAGEDAAQVFTLDLASGERHQVTRLPDVPSEYVGAEAALRVFFVDEETIGFYSRANPPDPDSTGSNPKGLNSDGHVRTFKVKLDGSHLVVLPEPIALPGGIRPEFHITGLATSSDVVPLSLPGADPPVNLPPFLPTDTPITELFLLASDHQLQLTNFRRYDTGFAFRASDGQRAYFIASANPPELGHSNPSENCQIFSISVLGDDLRQLTHFRSSDHSTIGCSLPTLGQSECFIFSGPIVDPQTDTLLFESDCDPLGTGVAGGQFFAMRTDGTGLRQLTATRGVVTAADGSVEVELAGPPAYQAFR